MVDQKASRGGIAVFKRILSELQGYRWHMCAIAILGIVTAPLALLQPFALKIALDSYLGEAPLPSWLSAIVPSSLLALEDRRGYLIAAAALIVVVALIQQTLGMIRKRLRISTKERLVLNFRMRLFGHVERLSLDYHDAEGPTESTFKILMDTAVIPGVLLDGVIPSLLSLVLLCTIATVIFTLSWQLALIALLFAPLLLLLSWPFGRKLRKQWHEVKDLDATVMGNLQEVFSAVRVIKTYGREQGEIKKLFSLAEKGLWARIKVTMTQARFSALMAISTAMGTAAFLYMGSTLVKGGSLQLGELIMVAALMVQFFSPLQLLVGQVAAIQSSLASAERVLDLLDLAPEVVDAKGAQSLARAKGAIAFKDVAFAYRGGDPVLKEISFDVQAGQRIGIAGTTGAGKTTLMNLLTRLYDPKSGVITLDSVDLKDIKIDDLRRQFAVVLQEPVLFKSSVASNIAYGVPEASREAVIEAAKLANAHDFIQQMPEGYDSIVGSRGQQLSGGERQRISLARAFLKDSPILILDEPTSSVDMRTESAIIDALERLMDSRTTFIIAHRSSTLEFCDRLLLLDRGRVESYTEVGNAADLDALMRGGAAGEKKVAS